MGKSQTATCSQRSPADGATSHNFNRNVEDEDAAVGKYKCLAGCRVVSNICTAHTHTRNEHVVALTERMTHGQHTKDRRINNTNRGMDDKYSKEQSSDED